MTNSTTGVRTAHGNLALNCRIAARFGPSLLILLIMGANTMAADIEEPRYTLVVEIGKVEIRQYEPVVQAVTVMASDRESSSGFRRLAGFIFGGNNTGESIAMTAPVQETLSAENPEMAFTMPSSYSLNSLPTPRDAQVKLVSVPQRTVATIAFSGWATQGKIRRNTEALMTALASRGIAANGTPMLNQYNPPWTPPFLRRNEVMIEVALRPDLNDRVVYAF